MNFGKFDVVLLMTMGFAVIVASFAFPALGLTADSDKVNESDVPEFNVSGDRFNLVGEFPESPGQPTAGTLERNESEPTIPGEYLQWIDLPESDGTSIELANVSGNMEIWFRDWSGGSAVAKDEYTITSEGQTIVHSNASWTIVFEVETYENAGQPNMTAIVDWSIEQSPNNNEGGWLSSVPVLGGLFQAGEQLASMLGWLGNILFWAFGTVFETTLNLVGILFDVTTYMVSMGQWLLGTYTSIISAAPSWAGVVLAIPGILIFAEFAKMMMIGISLLPTT